MISAKLDGLSMVCYFVNGKFTKALTRGRNGIGINRTDKIEKILNKELDIPTGFNFTGAIRGEVCISNSQWENMIKRGLIEKDNPSVNPRNVAAGIIGRDEINDDINFVDLVFYKVVGFNDDNNSWNKIYKESILENKKYDVKFLRKFIKDKYIVDYIEDNGSQLNQNALETLYNRFNSIYTCDGCVITKSDKNVSKLNDKYQNKIALENNEIAYKFEGEKVITTIENIRWKMSKGNKAIPVINVTPVELSGAIVQNASAYNAKYIYENERVPLYEGREDKKEKPVFRPTPIISPIYGILDKNYKKEEIVTKKPIILSTGSSKKMDVDMVREKAYGDLASDISASMQEEKEDEVKTEVTEDYDEKENTFYDLNIGSPAVEKVTVGDAEEYFNDLGLEYNVDYKDNSVTKATGRRSTKLENAKESKEDKKEKNEKDETSDDSASLENNLFDLIESMYEDKEE